MPKTSARLNMDFSPITGIPFSVQTSTNDNNIGNINELIVQNSTIQKSNYATLEHNIFLLDGTFIISEPNICPYGYFGNELSDNEGTLSQSNINITFNKPVELSGITLDFGNIFSLSGTCKITSDSDNETSLSIPDNGKIVFNNTKYITEIVITFTKTKFPNMYTRLNDIYLGLYYKYTDKEIVSVVFNEEVSPISSVLPVNTASVTLYLEDMNFDILNSEKYFPSPQLNTQSNILCIIDDKTIPLFNCYFDSLEFLDIHSIKLNFVSITKRLENNLYVPFSIMSANIQSMLYEVFRNINLFNFDKQIIDYSPSYPVYLKKNTQKEILHQLLFLFGYFCIDTYSLMFNIKKFDIHNIYNLSVIYPNYVIDDIKYTKINPYNKVVVDTYDYERQSVVKHYKDLSYTQVYSGDILDSIYIEFDKPTYWFRYRFKNKYSGDYLKQTDYNPNTGVPGPISSAMQNAIVTYNRNNKPLNSFASVVNDSPEEDYTWCYNNCCGGYGYRLTYTFHPNQTNISVLNFNDYYIEIEVAYYNELKSQYSLTYAKTYVTENLLYISSPQIFSTSNVRHFALNMLNYYKDMDLKIELSYIFNGDVRVGDNIYLYLGTNKYILATVVKQSIDVTQGCISKITCMCSSKNLVENSIVDNFMTSDSNSAMYMGDNILI